LDSNEIQRISFVGVAGEKDSPARRRWVVGGLTVAPARVGSVRGEVVVDGEAPGTGGSSGDGSNRRRRAVVLVASGGEIEGLQRLMSMGE
jgi:hypothetical protein